MNHPFTIYAPPAGRLVAAAILLLLSTSAGMAQFHAVPNPDGDTVVLDAEGAPVDIAPADPIGVKPDYCPHTSYYVFEVQTDKTELVLADCLTGLHQFTVDMQGLIVNPGDGG